MKVAAVDQILAPPKPSPDSAATTSFAALLGESPTPTSIGVPRPPAPLAPTSSSTLAHPKTRLLVAVSDLLGARPSIGPQPTGLSRSDQPDPKFAAAARLLPAIPPTDIISSGHERPVVQTKLGRTDQRNAPRRAANDRSDSTAPASTVALPSGQGCALVPAATDHGNKAIQSHRADKALEAITNQTPRGPGAGLAVVRSAFDAPRAKGDAEALGEQRAFGFNELSSFGAPMAQLAADGTPTAITTIGAGADTPVLDVLNDAAVSAPEAGMAASGSWGMSSAAPKTAAVFNDQEVVAPPETVFGSSSLVPHAASVGADVADEPSSTGEARSSAADALQQRRSLVTQSLVSVILSERDGVAQIVTASAGLSAEAGVRLRQAAQELVTEHGLSLSDFSLNGSPIKSQIAMIGGAHGRRGR
jgi:hypothetical protein